MDLTATSLTLNSKTDNDNKVCPVSLRGISPKTLSERLRSLEEEGVILRQTFAEVPPRVEYTLTEKGRDLIEVVECMRCYGKQWLCDASDM